MNFSFENAEYPLLMQKRNGAIHEGHRRDSQKCKALIDLNLAEMRQWQHSVQ